MFDYNIIVVTIVIIICLVCFHFMHVFNKDSNINEIIRNASLESEFSPTVFRIYDKSSKYICNRLIIISPFNWYLWACNNELFILNPDGGVRCSIDSCPAVQIFMNQFVETCLNLNINSILDLYVTGKTPTIIPYEIGIDSKGFTILSALDILKKKWITFDIEPDSNSYKVVHLEPAQRSLSGTDVIKMTRLKSNMPNIQKLHKSFIKHTYKLQSLIPNSDSHQN